MIKNEKKDYLSSIRNLVFSMPDDKLIILYDLHKKYYKKYHSRQNTVHRYTSFKELVFNQIKNHTPKSNYPKIIKVINLICAKYTYLQIENILLNN